MFRETAEVSQVWENKVKIKFTKKKMCSCCRISHICGMGEEKLEIEDCGLSLAAGDKIEVGVEEKRTLLAGLIMFLFPGIIFVLSLVIFKNRGEILSFFLAILMLGIYYGSVKILLRKQKGEFNLKILRKL